MHTETTLKNHSIMKHDHSTITQLGKPSLIILFNVVIKMPSIYMQKVNCAVLYGICPVAPL